MASERFIMPRGVKAGFLETMMPFAFAAFIYPSKMSLLLLFSGLMPNASMVSMSAS